MAERFELALEVKGRQAQRFKNAQRGLETLAGQFGLALSDLPPVAQRTMKEMLDTVGNAMRQRHSTPWTPRRTLPSGDRTGKLAKRSGKLITSIERSVKVQRFLNRGRDFEVAGKIGGLPTPEWLGVHEDGAVIRPKRAKFLTIPLPAALDSRGVPKKPRARDWPNTFVTKSRKGNLLIFQRRGARIVPLYVLKKQVRIPPRLGLGATLEQAAPVFVDRTFDRLLKEVQERI